MPSSFVKDLVKLGIKQHQFAEMLGVRPETLTTWKKQHEAIPKYAQLAITQMLDKKALLDILSGIGQIIREEARKIESSINPNKKS